MTRARSRSVMGRIAAGAIEAIQTHSHTISVPRNAGRGDISLSGDPMIDGISMAILLIKKRIPSKGEITVALVDEEATSACAARARPSR